MPHSFVWSMVVPALLLVGCSFASRPPVQNSPVNPHADVAPVASPSQVLDPHALPDVGPHEKVRT